MADKITRPKVNILPAAQFYELRKCVKIIEVSSDAGGCLVSMEVREGRLRIEVYRADDTVDVVAPGLVSTKRDMSHLAFPRTPTDQRAMNGE